MRLIEADVDLNAMLLGSVSRDRAPQLPEREQDVIVAGLLRRLWSRPAAPHAFRPLSAMTAHWADETRATAHKWSDPGLVQEGLRLFDELSRPSADDVLLATDLHAGNVLRAQREPWLVIDPKPFVGDRAYDATQHLFNCKRRMLTAPDATIHRVADLLGVDDERVRLWMFARSAAEPRDTGTRLSCPGEIAGLKRRCAKGQPCISYIIGSCHFCCGCSPSGFRAQTPWRYGLTAAYLFWPDAGGGVHGRVRR